MAKILYVITKSNFGGAQRYVHDLAAAAVAEGHDVVVATGGKGLLTQKLDALGVRTVSLPSLSQKRTFGGDLFSFSSLFALFALMRRERADVVHANSAKAGGLGCLAARLAGVPHVIFTAHGWEFLGGQRSRLSKAGMRFFSWLTILFSHRTIAVSQAVHDAVASWPFAGKKLLVIENGVEDFELLPAEKARHTLEKICPDTKTAFADPHGFLVGTLAELAPVKGLVYGIHAFAALPEEKRAHAYWIICGEGAERANLSGIIEALGLEQHIFLAGFVEEARSMLKAFDLFLFPSLFEAFAYAVLEAGHAGLPAVASDAGGIPEIIADDSFGILVPPRDTFGIARAVETLMDEREKRVALGRALKERVDAEFTRDLMVAKTFALYKLGRR